LLDWLSLPGLIGAALGLVIGWVDYRIVVAMLVPRLRKLDKSTTPAELADFEKRIVILRWALLVMTVGAFPVVGYLLGVTLIG
jgi:Na+(H+)/acetate symporter ActP